VLQSLRYRPLEADAKLTMAQFLDAKGSLRDAGYAATSAARAQVGGVREASAGA
jgi:hypothetical protein